MAEALTFILHGGGLRSLVATAMTLSQTKPQWVRLIHMANHRANAAPRAEHSRCQCEHFNIRRLIELSLPGSKSSRAGASGDSHNLTNLQRPRVLLAGLAYAIQSQAGRLIWPVQLNGDFDACACATEQVILVQSLAQLEADGDQSNTLPDIETPLLELDDQQVIELGEHLGVPWNMAWTCLLRGEKPCGICQACRQRHAAFEAAGIIDPVNEPLVAH